MSRRSRLAPDLPGASAITSRRVALASRPVTASWRWPLPAGCRSVTSGFHLGAHGGRPPAAAEHSVSHDQIIPHGEDVQVMGRVRHAVLRPAEGVFHHFGGTISGGTGAGGPILDAAVLSTTAADQIPAQFLEPARLSEPARVLGPYRVRAEHAHAPVGHRRIQRRLCAPSVAAGDCRVLDCLQELVDYR